MCEWHNYITYTPRVCVVPPRHAEMRRAPNEQRKTRSLCVPVYPTVIVPQQPSDSDIHNIVHAVVCVRGFPSAHTFGVRIRSLRLAIASSVMCVCVPFSFATLQHFHFLPAVVGLDPGLARRTPVLGDERHSVCWWASGCCNRIGRRRHGLDVDEHRLCV